MQNQPLKKDVLFYTLIFTKLNFNVKFLSKNPLKEGEMPVTEWCWTFHEHPADVKSTHFNKSRYRSEFTQRKGHLPFTLYLFPGVCWLEQALFKILFLFKLSWICHFHFLDFYILCPHFWNYFVFLLHTEITHFILNVSSVFCSWLKRSFRPFKVVAEKSLMLITIGFSGFFGMWIEEQTTMNENQFYVFLRMHAFHITKIHFPVRAWGGLDPVLLCIYMMTHGFK